MKLLIMPNSIKQVNELLENIDGIIVGLDKLCINMPYNFSLDEINELITICNENDKEIFISLNKNMFNKDLDYLKEILLTLDSKNITGIFYYDIAIVNMKEELNLKLDLVWNQEHLTTNYLTSNFWNEHGAAYTALSSEITLDEVKEIKKNAKAKLMFTAFGYLPMFVSRRHLVKNYLDTFNLKDNSKINYITKEDKVYQIIDTVDGTIAYSDKVLNAISEVNSLDIDYIILNSFSIPNDIFKDVTHMFKNVNSANKEEYKEKIDSMLDTYLGFLYKETIYKVKKND